VKLKAWRETRYSYYLVEAPETGTKRQYFTSYDGLKTVRQTIFGISIPIQNRTANDWISG